MTLRPQHISSRPGDIPASINVTGMDFEKRRLIVTSVSGMTMLSLMPSISDAIVTYEDTVISHENNVIYQL